MKKCSPVMKSKRKVETKIMQLMSKKNAWLCQRGALSTGQINSKTLKNRIGWDILISLFQSFLTPNQALCLVVH